MKKWELAYYLIEAKKCVDSLFYIEQNLNDLQNLGAREVVQDRLRNFYINCRVVIDKAFAKQEKKKASESDTVFCAILTEADKNYAHKDDNYKPPKFDNMGEMVSTLKVQITHLKGMCGASLPSNITLDFVPHDRILFRTVNGITAADEEEVKKMKHPHYGRTDGKPMDKAFKVLHSVEQMKEEEVSRENYAVILSEGINDHEGLQNRQDWCIKINTLHGENMWCSIAK